jgi:hypothetical protein
MRLRLITVFLVLTLPSTAAAQARASVTGAIEGVISTLHETVRLPGARVVVRDARELEVATVLSDGDGRFHVGDLAPGRYRVAASLDGFTTVSATTVVTEGKTSDLPIDLAIATLSDTIDVVASATVVSSAAMLSPSESVGARELDQFSPGGGLGGAMRLLANVIVVPGGLSIKGGRATQAGIQIGPSTLTEPAMGLLHLTLPDDAIDSVAVLPNPYAVEYGRFSSGLVVIQTRRATDQWKARVNNLDPTLRTKRHRELYHVKGIAGFGPRLEVGGPIVKERLFLEQAAQYRYSTDEIPSRPEDERYTTHWFSSFSRVDANLSPRHALMGMGGFYPSVTHRAGLATFVPPESTVDRHDRAHHLSVTERSLWRDTLIGESTLQVQGHRAEVRPQGGAPMELWPDSRFGHFYNTQTRMPSTLQWIDTLSGSSNRRSGLHLFKIGVDLLYSRYDGSSASRPVLIRRPNGTLARRIDFTGATRQHVRSTDVALFVQDRVQPNPRWFTEFGARVDRDGIVERWNVTPRLGAAVLLNESGTSVLRGGFGLFYERTPSAAGAFDQFEQPTETRFAADGVTPLGVPVPFRRDLDASDLRTARSATWDVSYDYRWNARWSVHSALLNRRGNHELVLDTSQRDGAGTLSLESEGRSRYRDLEVGLHYARGARGDLHMSYAHSMAHSDQNAFAAYFDTMMWPVVAPNEYGIAGTDVPHRLLGRGHVMPTDRWLLLGVLDWRTGFPYSLTNESLDFVGPRNALRLPNRLNLDLGIEHRFHIFKWQPWIGVRAYNALNSFNPSEVQANIASPAFGGLYNSDYRQLRLQLRFSR